MFRVKKRRLELHNRMHAIRLPEINRCKDSSASKVSFVGVQGATEGKLRFSVRRAGKWNEVVSNKVNQVYVPSGLWSKCD